MKKNILFHQKKILLSDGNLHHSAEVYADYSLTSYFQKVKLNKKWVCCVTFLLLLFSNTSLAQSVNLDQGKNETPVNPDLTVLWVNGNLNANQSHYLEGMSIPYRARIEGLANNTVYILDIGIDTRDGSLAALDYYTHYDRIIPHTQFIPPHLPEFVNPISTGVTGPFSGPTTFAVPAPTVNKNVGAVSQPVTSFNSLPAGERLMTMWNGTITNVQYVLQDPLTQQSSKTNLRITFTSGSNVVGKTVVLAWGGHIAKTLDWNGEAHPGGSPYHCRLIDMWINSVSQQNRINLGNQDRSLKSEAVFTCGINGPISVCAGTQNQYTLTTNVGGTPSWAFTSNTAGASFVGGINTGSSVTVTATHAGSFTVAPSVSNTNGGITCDHTVTVVANPFAGTGSSDRQCLIGASVCVNLFNLLLNEDAGGSWSQVSGPTKAVATPNNHCLTENGVYVYRYTVTPPAGSNCPPDSEDVTITIDDSATAGTGSPARYCKNNAGLASVDLFALLAGEDAGGVWKNAADETVTSPINLSAFAAPGSYTFTYTVTPVQGSECPPDSESVTITIDNTVTAGIGSPARYCKNNAGLASVDLFALLAGEDAGGVWKNAADATVTSPINLSAFAAPGSYTFTYIVTPAAGSECPPDSESVTITIDNTVTAGVGSPARYCKNNAGLASVDLFALLAGEEAGGVWKNAADATVTSPINLSTFAAPGSYTFTYTVTPAEGSECSPDSESVTITIDNTVTAGVGSPSRFCKNNAGLASVDLFALLAGEDTGGVWKNAADETVTSPINLSAFAVPGSYTFTYTVTPPEGSECPPDSESVTITIDNTVTAGVGSPASYCKDNVGLASVDLFALLAGEDTGGVWKNAADETVTSPIDLSTFAAPGSYTFTYTVTPAAGSECPSDSESVTITINPRPGAICADKTFEVDCLAGLNLTQLQAAYNASFDAWFTTDFIALNPALDSNSSSFNPNLSYSTVPSLATLTAMTMDVLNPSIVAVTFTITNNVTGCQSSCSSSFFFNNPCAPGCNTIPVNYVCFGDSGKLTISGNGTAPFSIQVFKIIAGVPTPVAGSPFTQSSNPFSFEVSNLLAGDYRTIVTDALNIPGDECIRNVSISGSLSALSCNLTQPAIVGCGTAGNIVSGTASGGTGPYSVSASFDGAGLAAGWSANGSIVGNDITVTYTAGGIANTVLTVVVTDANGCEHSCDVTLNCDGGKACTPGFWKNHREVWDQETDYTVHNMPGSLPSTPGGTFITTTNFFTYFGISPSPSISNNANLNMLGATNLGGGNCKALARHAVSALLGAAAFPDDYPFEAAGVTNFEQLYLLIRNAFVNGHCNDLANTLATINELDGPFCGALSQLPSAKIEEIYTQVESSMFTVYPVPFKDNFTILYEFDYKTDVVIQVFDSRGRLLLNTTDKDAYKGKEMKIEFPLTHQKGELFFIRIETNRGHYIKNISSSTN